MSDSHRHDANTSIELDEYPDVNSRKSRKAVPDTRGDRVVGRAGVRTIPTLRRFLMIMLAMLLGCRGQEFVVTSEVIGPPIVGFGAQMNPYLYSQVNRAVVNETNV